MAIQWSGLGPELLLRLDRSSGHPLRSQLEAGLREAIRSGRLQGGERLPSSRELARELDVSRGLVQEVYGQLLSEGYLTSQVGSATRVAAGAYQATAEPVQHAEPPPRLIADFRSGVPDLASFPRGDWVWATREACGSVATLDLDYGDPRGSAVLRGVLAGYLRRVRAAAADPGQLIVSTGFAQGIILVLRALALAGVRCAAFEDPGYGGADTSETVRAAAAMGLRTVHVPVDDLGVDVRAVERSGAQVVVVTPAHQSPTGVVLAAGGATPWWSGRTAPAGSSSRTTTTPSSATTASPSACCRGWPRGGSSPSARPARRWPRGCASAGSSPRPRWPPPSRRRSGSATAARPPWISWCWRPCSSRAGMTATSAGCGRSTPAAAPGSSTVSPGMPPASG